MMDDPLPAPTGAAAMAKFLEPRAEGPPAAGAAAGPATAAPHGAQPSTTTATVQPEPQRPQPQRPPPQQAQQQQQQAGMSRLEFETCVAMHGILAKYKEADPFRQPVDVEGLGIPDYYDVIKKPMDLKTVRDKVRETAEQSGSAAHLERTLKLHLPCFQSMMFHVHAAVTIDFGLSPARVLYPSVACLHGTVLTSLCLAWHCADPCAVLRCASSYPAAQDKQVQKRAGVAC